MSQCTILVVLRDRFSPSECCLDAILANTPKPYELLVVLGACPEVIQKKLVEKYGHVAQFIFEAKPLNSGAYRNIGLRAVKTPLAAIVENDVSVAQGWLEPMLRCLSEEKNAAMVMPLILERNDHIHTAGNTLFVTHKNGKACGQKVLRFGRMTIYEGHNLKRVPVDYGELHCQLVHVETALRLGVYDEHLREIDEVNSGLTWAKAGHTMWFEPSSSVFYDVPGRITQVEDIKPFQYKWDMREILKSYDYFDKKWNMDITECGRITEFLTIINNQLGLLSRIFPSRISLALDNFFYHLRRLLGLPVTGWRNFKAWIFGNYEWRKP